MGSLYRPVGGCISSDEPLVLKLVLKIGSSIGSILLSIELLETSVWFLGHWEVI